MTRTLSPKAATGFETILFGSWMLMFGVSAAVALTFVREREINLTGAARREGIEEIQGQLQQMHRQANQGSLRQTSRSWHLRFKVPGKSQCLRGFRNCERRSQKRVDHKIHSDFSSPAPDLGL